MIDYALERQKRSALATSQQRKAAHPAHSVWVEASAGTGKTKVLSDRVLRLLLSRVSPSKILCLTYTKAAAVEMSTRIAGRLARFSIIGDEELHQELSHLLGDLPESKKEYDKLMATARRLFAILLDTAGGMKIQTIHSFCQEILKRFPLEAKISPYFEVMDDRASQEALENVQSKLLQKIELEPESDDAKALAFLTKRVSEFCFPKIMVSIASNRSKISKIFEQYGCLKDLLADLAERLDINPEKTKEDLIDAFAKATNKEMVKKIMTALFEGTATDIKKAEIIAGYLANESSVEAYRAAFLNKDGSLPAKPATKGVVDKSFDIIEQMTFEAKRIQNLEKKLTAMDLFASTKAVLVLAGEMIKGYNHFKQLHSKMDYEDLIVITKNLLEKKGIADWVLFKLDGGIDHVLIDEAQDTSPDQWAIIKALTDEFFVTESNRTVFTVGDRKQSIYSFQGADVSEFEKSKNHFKTKANNFKEVRLDVSFRSTSAVMDVVNNVFMDNKLSGVVLEEPHQPFRIGDGGKIELWDIIKPVEGENPNIWKKPVERIVGDSTSSRLAKEIAKRIKGIVEKKEVLASQGRAVKFRDFMVLVQRRNSFVEELVREFKNAGVNVAGVDKIRLLEQIAIQDLIAVGKFLLLPTDDLILATILKSPLFGLDDDDLFELCYDRNHKPLWTVLSKNPKFAKTYADLQEILAKTDFVRPFELYSHILNKMQGRKKFVERMGLEVEDGLDEFMNMALGFEREHIPSLQLFIDWISKDEVEIKRELEQSEVDAVRIMTVHGSKGLQAPIVILPDSLRVPPAKKESKMLWDDLPYYPLSSAEYDENCDRIFEKGKAQTIEEYRRLLYVALTRAEDRLYVCGYQKKNAPSEDSWYKVFEANMQELGEKRGEELHYEVSQNIAPKKEKEKESVSLFRPDFDWIHKNAVEEGPLAKPLTPSKMEDEEEEVAASPIGLGGKNRYLRGQVIHKLLQFLPEVKDGNKREVVEQFIKNNMTRISDFEISEMTDEVMNLLQNDKFRHIFDENSKAEVPIMGMVDGKIISAQIDRLVVRDKEVLIFDYKTNRPAARELAEVAPQYLKQMQVYIELLKKIYVDCDVKAYIIWTDISEIMQIV